MMEIVNSNREWLRRLFIAGAVIVLEDLVTNTLISICYGDYLQESLCQIQFPVAEIEFLSVGFPEQGFLG